jgi:hypothetical protein
VFSVIVHTQSKLKWNGKRLVARYAQQTLKRQVLSGIDRYQLDLMVTIWPIVEMKRISHGSFKSRGAEMYGG